jgi:pimeloyl-ACP methyl ester carboxylesterase
MRGQGRAITVGVGSAILALLTGCAPWLAANPHFATDSARNPEGGPVTSSASGGPQAWAVPKNDLVWKDCTSKGFGDAGAQPTPGVQLECADYDADLDPIAGATGTVTIGVMRARSVKTPADAGPLVFTTGSDLPSSLQLPVWLSRSGVDALASHPIVAVDRRGMGMSSPIECRDDFDRQQMREQAQFVSGDDPVASLQSVTQTATTGCTDAIAPGDSAYDSARAAEDLERLRSTWDVPALALMGVGNGAEVALAYAGSHPEKVARLVLDSPTPPGVSGGRSRGPGQGPAGRTGRLHRPVRRGQLSTRTGPEGRGRRTAGGGPRRQGTGRDVGGGAGQRDRHGTGLPHR